MTIHYDQDMPTPADEARQDLPLDILASLPERGQWTATADDLSRAKRSTDTEDYSEEFATFAEEDREAKVETLRQGLQELRDNLHRVEELTGVDMDSVFERLMGMSAEEADAVAAPADEPSRTARSTDTEDAGEQAVMPAQGERVLRIEDLPQNLQDFRESMLRVEKGTGVDMEAVFERLMSVHPEYWTQPDNGPGDDGGSSRERRSIPDEEAPIFADNVCGPEGQSDALSVFALEDWPDERIDAILDRVLGPDDEDAAEDADFVWTVDELAGVVDTAYSMLNEVGCPISV